MPADRLTHAADPDGITEGDRATLRTEEAVLHVLTGAALTDTASTHGLTPHTLRSAARAYRQAGRQALQDRASTTWTQLYIQFADWHTSEEVAIQHLAPVLHRAEQDRLVSAWWFIWKHPCMRLRLAGHAGGEPAMHLHTALDDLARDGAIAAWWPGIYEPETAAFGGNIGITVAHDLAYADSRAILTRTIEQTGLGRRELSLLLLTTLMRSARLEWYEQGDVWDRVTHERPLPNDIDPTKLAGTADQLGQLMLGDTTPNGPLLKPDGPLAAASDWFDAYRRAGHDLGVAARNGALHRGLRTVLSYLVIFHQNRLRLEARTQCILAAAARMAILGRSPAQQKRAETTQPAPSPPIGFDPDRVLARLPLLPGGRRHCPDLATRIQEIRQHVTASQQATMREDRVDHACSAWNLTALIASDCGKADLAAELCLRQATLFHRARPLSGPIAIAGLQPLVNLARLTARAGDHEGAYRAYIAIDQGIRHGGDVTIRGTQFSFSSYATAETTASVIAPWLRQVLRDDATRALAAAGRWQQAAEHASQYDDSPDQLCQARQTRIIADILAGDTNSALALIDSRTSTEPWADAVAACLRRYAHVKAGLSHPDDLTAMLTAIRLTRRSSQRSTQLIHTGLALLVLDLSGGNEPRQTEALFAELMEDVERTSDMLAARDVLNHEFCKARMTPTQAATLAAKLQQAGLGTGTVSDTLLDELAEYVDIAKSVLMDVMESLP